MDLIFLGFGSISRDKIREEGGKEERQVGKNINEKKKEENI